MAKLPEWVSLEDLHKLSTSNLPQDWKLHDYILDRLGGNPSKKSVLRRRLYVSRFGLWRLDLRFTQWVKERM